MITLKQLGQNVVTIIDGNNYSKRIPDKGERDAVVAMIKEYNKNPNDSDKQAIVDILSAKTKEVVKKEEPIKKEIKQLTEDKKTIKKKVEAKQKEEEDELAKRNAALQEENAKLKKDLETAQAKSATQPKSETTSYSRRGEY